MINQPAILPENAESRKRRAFLRFQAELMMFEEAMKSLQPNMSIDCRYELQEMGRICRSFFTMANQELFSQVAEKVSK